MSASTPSSDPERTEIILRAGACVFGRYVLAGIVGEGGMGVVWRARDKKLDREVALKFLPDRVRRDPEAIRDLKRETNRCLDLTHPNIVRVYDFVEDSFAAAIAMEYVPGQSLSALKAARPSGCFDPADLAPLVRQLCAALDYAHLQARVVHRDLKPANVLVTADGVLRIADFGIARSLVETQTRQTGDLRSSAGTLAFMGPQQLAGQKGTPADDIYALGATLYDLLTGKPPFFSGDQFQQIRETTPAPLAERRAELENTGAPIPPAWEETILACLEKDPTHRPKSAGEVAERLGIADRGLRSAELQPAEGRAIPLAADKVGRVVPAPAGKPNAPPSDERRTKDSPPYLPKSKMPLYAGLAVGAVLIIVAVVFWPRPPSAQDAPRSSRREEAGAQKPASNPSLVTSAATNKTKPAAPTALPHLPAEALAKAGVFTVTVDPPDMGAHLWLGPQSDVAVPAGGRAVVKDLPDGEHELIVQAAGYQPFTTRVTVKDGRGSAEAKLVALKGAFTLKARAGTVVTAVDARGKETHVGIVPPGGTLSSDNRLTIGTYLFKFTHADCAEARQKDVELAFGRIAQLAPAQPGLPGELRIFTVPMGAEVRVDGKKLGVTPATLREQPSEQALRVEVFLRGYRRIEQSVTLKPAEVRTLNLGTLAAERGGVELRMTNGELRMENVAVAIDGRSAALQPAPSEVGRVIPNAPSAPAERRIRDNPPYLLEGLEVGQRTVEITHPDYEPWQQSVTVRDQQNTAVEVKLQPKPGRLVLRVEPSQIVLTVNGRTVRPDEITDGELTLPAGESHALVASANGFQPAMHTFTLPANGRATWDVALKKQSVPESGQPWENTLGMKFVAVPGTDVLFSIWDTRVQDYEKFAQATRRAWGKPDFAQGQTHPAVNVSWDDAQAFCAWLTETERAAGRLGPTQKYRLPTDAEWSVMVVLDEPRGGTPQSKDMRVKDVYPWNTPWPPPRGAGNYADETARRTKHTDWTIISGYDDGYADTSPVGSFAANKYGLYDMGGNVWQWCEDFYEGNSGPRVMRGGSFNTYESGRLFSSSRYYRAPGIRYINVGFRCVVSVAPATARTSGGEVPAKETARAPMTVDNIRGPEAGQTWTIPDLGLVMQPIAAGTFTMGTASGGSDDERPVTRITITQPFWLGKTEVTQREWTAVMESNPSYFEGDDRPVENVSWTGAMEFCRKLTERERSADRLPEGYAYTLPTEAQWEYACRAGTTGDYAGSLDAMGWYDNNSGDTTHAVGQKQANAWGLYDMHGNVWEWCADWYADKLPGGSVRDQAGPSSGSFRVIRGGCWGNAADGCRSAYRGRDAPGRRWRSLGFRVALAPQVRS